MSEHTPTPWYHRQAGETSGVGDPYDWIADSPERGKHRKIIVARDSCYCVADYAFIVKAVNRDHHFDALLKALEFIRDGYDNPDVNHVDFRVKAYQVAIETLETLALPPADGVRR